MRGRLKRDEWIIEALRLPVGLALSPVAVMPSDSKYEFVMADILRALIRVAAASARSANQREANSVIVWFV